MAIQSSFPKIADQILTFNKNIIELLTKLNSVATSTNPTVSVDIVDENGVLTQYQIPSTASLKTDIERLNNNINSLYSIDAAGAMIQNTTTNKFKKIITVDLNREPNQIASLNTITSFTAKPNWFFDSLTDPMLSVEFDLSGKIEDNVRKCLCRRYIVDFAKEASGLFTNLGQSAITSFNTLFKNNTNIGIEEFENWHKTTPGIVDPLNPRFDEQVFDLEPNSLLYDGEFSVLRIQEDRINRKLYYVLNTLDYLVIETAEVRQLAVGDELFVNSTKTSTRYKIIEVSTAESNPRVRVERIEGLEPIPVGLGTLKIYSPVIFQKSLQVSIGYDERNVVFVKPINTEHNLVARKWSAGVGYYTNELLLSDETSAKGLNLENYYVDYVYDYGEALKDMVQKKTPTKLAGEPNVPVLDGENFKVVQINQHLTDTPDSNLIKVKHNMQLNLKSEVQQLQNASIDRIKKLKVARFKSVADKKKSDLEIKELNDKTTSKQKQLATLSQEIIDLSKSPKTKVEPKYRVRGFWEFPESVATRGTKPQEIVQFKVQYRYISKDGREAPIQTFKLGRVSGFSKTNFATATPAPTTSQPRVASFSNWNEFKTDARKRAFDPVTNEYFWQIEDVESADTPNINQLDIAIQANEKVEIRIKSISEVGWPDSPVESEWSETITVEFPDDLNTIVNETDFMLREATKEDLKATINNELAAKGLDTHLEDQIILETKTFHHESANILSGFRDANGEVLDLFQYLRNLEAKVKALEEKIEKAKGELEVVIFRNNQEFAVNNGSETVFNIECEDYLELYRAPGVPTGRVYENNVYVIKDFVVKIKNKSVSSPLGLLSDKLYLQNSSIYDSRVPQTFWVNNKDELITSDSSGVSRTQVNNQFVWQVNYDSISEGTVNNISANIGNKFIARPESGGSISALGNAIQSKNSLANALSDNQRNIGFAENSVLSFIGNNKSLLESTKWVDTKVSVASTTKLLTTIHPVVQSLDKITETNSSKIKTVNSGDKNDIIIPINIYFKMNALDNKAKGVNFKYIDLSPNKDSKPVKHTKKLKFLLENEAENRPFTFSIKFNINRSKTVIKKTSPALNLQLK
jgi:hypothetical protein